MNPEFLKTISLEGKRVLISGSSRGIGFACAKYLSNLGASIFGVARGKEDLNSMYHSLYGNGHRTLAIDLSTENGIDELVSGIEEWGIPDIIIANLYIRTTPLKLTELKNTNQTKFLEDLKYLIHILPVCLPVQRQKKFGRWIGISSMVANLGGPGQAIYSIKKNSVESLFKTLAIEEGKNQITANTVSPGIILSPGTIQNYSKELLDTYSKMNLIGRAGSEEEVAHAVAFLASPLASYITGINIPVCAGYDLSWGIQYALEKKLNL